MHWFCSRVSIRPDDRAQSEFAVLRAHLARNSPKRAFRAGNKGRRLFSTVRFSIVFHRPIKASLFEPNLGPRRSWRRRWRIKDLHQVLENLDYRCLVNVKTAGKLFLKSGKLSGEVWTCQKRFPHPGKSSDNKNAHLHSPWAIQNIRGHQSAVFL